MDTRDGTIYYGEQYIPKDAKPFVKAMEVPPTARQLKNMKVGRNDPCPCGSREKFKRCCMMKIARGEVTT